MLSAAIIGNGIAAFGNLADGALADDGLAVAAGDIEDIGGLAQA